MFKFLGHIGCLMSAVLLFGAILMSTALIGQGIEGQGEDPGSSSLSATGELVTSSADDFQAGEISDSVKPALAQLFIKTGNDINVPAFLLAAISAQECGRINSLQNEKLTELIENNLPFPIRKNASKNDLGHQGCAYDNGSNVWGPMQFQYMTFFGYPRGRKGAWQWEGKTYTDTWASSFIALNPRYHPKEFPVPLPNSNGGLATNAIRKFYPDSAIGSREASIISLKDSVYASAIYLRALARRKSDDTSPWTEEQLKKAACGYYGACSDSAANYWPEVRQKIERYKSKLES